MKTGFVPLVPVPRASQDEDRRGHVLPGSLTRDEVAAQTLVIARVLSCSIIFFKILNVS